MSMELNLMHASKQKNKKNTKKICQKIASSKNKLTYSGCLYACHSKWMRCRSQRLWSLARRVPGARSPRSRGGVSPGCHAASDPHIWIIYFLPSQPLLLVFPRLASKVGEASVQWKKKKKKPSIPMKSWQQSKYFGYNIKIRVHAAGFDWQLLAQKLLHCTISAYEITVREVTVFTLTTNYYGKLDAPAVSALKAMNILFTQWRWIFRRNS